MDGVEREEVGTVKCTKCYDKNLTKRRYKQSPLCTLTYEIFSLLKFLELGSGGGGGSNFAVTLMLLSLFPESFGIFVYVNHTSKMLFTVAPQVCVAKYST